MVCFYKSHDKKYVVPKGPKLEKVLGAHRDISRSPYGPVRPWLPQVVIAIAKIMIYIKICLAVVLLLNVYTNIVLVASK